MVDETELAVFEKHGIGMGEPFIWYAPNYRLSELLELSDSTLSMIETTDSPRVMVLEAWLFLDFMVREFVYAGLQLDDYAHEKFDPRYELLPRSFEALLRLIPKIRDTQRTRPVRPVRAQQLSGDFMIWLDKNHRDLLDQMIDAEEAFVLESEADLPPSDREELDRLRTEWWTRFRRAPDPWLNMAEKITESWAHRARKLTKARNTAAHRTDPNGIARTLGCNGRTATECVRKFVTQLVRELLGIMRVDRALGPDTGSL